jgi:hypothetical protein
MTTKNSKATAAPEPAQRKKSARRAEPPKAVEAIDRAVALLDLVRGRLRDEDLEDAVALIRIARYRTGVEVSRARRPKRRR